MPKIVAIAGSYRKGGIVDQAVDVAVQEANRRGADVDVVQLRDFPIGFCTNCRQCTQMPGDGPAECVQRDGMRDLVAKIEAADAFILASPTNVYAVTALFKRFMERLVIYSYWPWGKPAPKLRKRTMKKAIVITSWAAPPVLGRLFFSSVRGLKTTATMIGAKAVGGVCIGLAAGAPNARLRASDARRIERAIRLIS